MRSANCSLLYADVGEYVAQDDVIMVLETDKVAVEIRAPTSGVLVDQLANVREYACAWRCVARSLAFIVTMGHFSYDPSTYRRRGRC